MQERDRLNILGLPVDRVDRAEALAVFDRLLDSEGLSVIVTPNSEILENATRDEALADIIRRADLVIPDGVGLLHASRILGRPLKERVTGIDFSYAALQRLAARGESAYLLGSRPGVAKTAAQKLTEQIPGLVIAGVHDGYFKPEDEEALVREINASGARFLCVALGSPKQEKFLYDHRSELAARVGIGIGGSLDVWSGTLKRAPAFWQKLGLEWLYRLGQQPSRIARTARLPVFLCKVFFSKNKE